MSTFRKDDSYKHRMAQEVLREWFYWGRCIGDIGTNSTSRTCGVWFDYPLIKNGIYNSVDHNWDEQATNPHATKESESKYVHTSEFEPSEYTYSYINYKEHSTPPIQSEYVPTYRDCVKLNIYPTLIVDVVIPCKGKPTYYIEICNKHPTPPEKIRDLKRIGVDNLIEIDADWILSQTKRPFKLEYRRLI